MGVGGGDISGCSLSGDKRVGGGAPMVEVVRKKVLVVMESPEEE